MSDQESKIANNSHVNQAPLNDSTTSEEQTSPSPDPSRVPILQGYLSKWTNYIHGWQDRWIVLTNGTLSYYKSDSEAAHGCRGAISLSKAVIKAHELDLCRFDISVNDCVWCLRAETEEDKQNWVDVLEGFKVESGYGSEINLTNSHKPDDIDVHSIDSQVETEIRDIGKELKLKISELNTYRDILFNQVDKIQTFLDGSQSSTKKINNDEIEQHDISSGTTCEDVDFRTESLLFKGTTSEVLTSLDQCLDLFAQREIMWGKRSHQEGEKRKKMMQGAAYSSLMKQTSHISGREEENSNGTSILGEDEFYDAVESGSQNSEDLGSRKSSIVSLIPTPSSATASHHLWPEIQKVVSDQIRYARMGLGEGQWQLFANEGEMKMYRREEEIKGMVMDPLKACHMVKGVTGHEMCHYFFRPEYREDWETTLDEMHVAETISEDTIVFWQKHKSIWPVTKRDALFWSHITQVPDPSDRDAQNIWIVVNNSTEMKEYPANKDKYIRLFLTVCMLCQTIVTPPKQGSSITRSDISCKITYCSVVNPGGWTPSSLLRTVYKREYPKFLKRFTSYVIDQCKNKPIMY